MAISQNSGQLLDGTNYQCPQCDVDSFWTEGQLIDHYQEEHGKVLPLIQRLGETERGVNEGPQNGNRQTTFLTTEDYKIARGINEIPERELYNLIYGDDVFTGHTNRDNRKELPITFKQFIDRNPSGNVKEYLAHIYDLKVRKAERRHLILHEKTENEYHAVKPVVRGTEKYKRKISDKINVLKEYLDENPQPATLLTLSPRNDGNPVEGLRQLKGVPNDIVAYIRQLRGWFDIDKYYWTLEPTERGYPHIHMLILGVNLESTLNPHETVGKWWAKHGYGESQGVDVEGLNAHESKEGVAAYMVKYLNKNIENDWFNGMIFLAGSRTLQFSEELNQIAVGLLRSESKVKEESDKKWVPIGLFDNWKRVKEKYGNQDIPPPPVLHENGKLWGNWLISQYELEQHY